MKTCPVGTELFQADRRTEGHDVANSRFSQFSWTRLKKRPLIIVISWNLPIAWKIQLTVNYYFCLLLSYQWVSWKHQQQRTLPVTPQVWTALPSSWRGSMNWNFHLLTLVNRFTCVDCAWLGTGFARTLWRAGHFWRSPNCESLRILQCQTQKPFTTCKRFR